MNTNNKGYSEQHKSRVMALFSIYNLNYKLSHSKSS